MTATGRDAAIVTIGSELTLGLRLDTNTRSIASALSCSGYSVVEAVSVSDDIDVLADALSRLCSSCSLVIATGGLGPTHDDITREAASRALGLDRIPDREMAAWLEGVASRHVEDEAVRQVGRQAEILAGAQIIRPTSGTAPGQVVPTKAGKLVLLPGPPHEMAPMLEGVLGENTTELSLMLRCVGISESDAQVRTSGVLDSFPGVRLTVLASPSLVDIILVDTGAGPERLSAAREAVREHLAPYTYAEDDTSLAEVVIQLAREAGVTIGLAESCTGGLLGGALTSIPGSSDMMVGGVIAYSNDIKAAVLDVSPATIGRYGAVSEETAREMAEGAARLLSADLTVSITGIAGPSGGSADKPVGLVCFGVSSHGSVSSFKRQFLGDRDGVRVRAVIAALDALRNNLGS